MDTELLGGMTTLMPEGLPEMQQSQYILHARGGELTKVPAEKSLLPHDPKGHVQAVSMALGPDGTIYVNQPTLLCKSTDGGRTWTVQERGKWPNDEEVTGCLQVLADGTFIAPVGPGGITTEPYSFLASHDQGRTWEKISQIHLPPQ